MTSENSENLDFQIVIKPVRPSTLDTINFGKKDNINDVISLFHFFTKPFCLNVIDWLSVYYIYVIRVLM